MGCSMTSSLRSLFYSDCHATSSVRSSNSTSFCVCSMTLDCLWCFKLNLKLHLKSLPRLICASVRSGPIVIHGPDRSVGLRCFWIGLGSVRSKFILESVRSDSISKIVGPAHWTEPNRDRTDVVHPCRWQMAIEHYNKLQRSK